MSEHQLNLSEELVVASHNPGKVREISELLLPYGMKVVSAQDLNLSEPEENGSTFAENALIKARSCAEASNRPALSDDSGLEVEALGGAPGLFSARWAGPAKDFMIAMERVNQELEQQGALDPQQRRANFICVLCLCWPDGTHKFYEGKIFGHLVWPPRGDKGFGYDPMFVADGHNITFGEMDVADKHALSHRARAFKLFVEDCFSDEPY